MGENNEFCWLNIRSCNFQLAQSVFTAVGLDEDYFHLLCEKWLPRQRLPFTSLVLLIIACYIGRCEIWAVRRLVKYSLQPKAAFGHWLLWIWKEIRISNCNYYIECCLIECDAVQSSKKAAHISGERAAPI